jgi:hypothetical protein
MKSIISSATNLGSPEAMKWNNYTSISIKKKTKNFNMQCNLIIISKIKTNKKNLRCSKHEIMR